MSKQQSEPIYLDPSHNAHTRTTDLLSRMTLEEKAGLMFHGIITLEEDPSAKPQAPFDVPSAAELIGKRNLSHFNLLGAIKNAKDTASWYNTIQKLALSETRLGIPVTLSTDPRNHFTNNVGTSFHAGVLSQWPETLGFAALRDTELVERFANIARKEYIALGFRCALHPQIDLATEYRWSRINATFGEDSHLTGQLVEAYIRGFQGDQFGKDSVSTVTKHFPGGGAQSNDGEDSHFDYGKDQAYPAGYFDYHLEPFKNAIRAGTRQMMPYYSKAVNTKYEEVAFAFNKSIVHGLLRQQLGFQGIVCTDWGVISDAVIMGQNMPARAWGCEHLSDLEKVIKVLDAGCDQFGGEWRPELVVEAVRKGFVTEQRIDQSIHRLLLDKFEMGLFDENRFVDVDRADEIVGCLDFRQLGLDTQRRSYTLLRNQNNLLPLSRGSLAEKKIYIDGIDVNTARSRNLNITDQLSEADIAIVRLRAPFEARSGGFESFFHAGSLEFAAPEIDRHEKLFSSVPIVIVDIYLDRPAVITHLAERASALLVNFGASSDALLDVVMGKDHDSGKITQPEGRLPFDLPRDMTAVCNSPCDKPFSTLNPLFHFGDGLRYC
jgi:beta-glucosidase-like glycosyl hydrolase